MLGLESYLKEHAAEYRDRVVVFTGPIFSAQDPAYRGVEIPCASSRSPCSSPRESWRPSNTWWTRHRNWAN
ncbi:hypothetical protein ACWF5H_01650 [Arthrobacter sp. NPDC055138]